MLETEGTDEADYQTYFGKSLEELRVECREYMENLKSEHIMEEVADRYTEHRENR